MKLRDLRELKKFLNNIEGMLVEQPIGIRQREVLVAEWGREISKDYEQFILDYVQRATEKIRFHIKRDSKGEPIKAQIYHRTYEPIYGQKDMKPMPTKACQNAAA